jgi:CheY-like chemotaxis protein
MNGHVRVLVVDDDDGMRCLFRSLIEATTGFAVVGVADSGEAAVERAAELAPDLLLMDYRMRGLDGIAAARQIVERQPGVSIILVSAGAVEEAELDGCGAIAFLRKQDLSIRRLRETWADCARPGVGALGQP